MLLLFAFFLNILAYEKQHKFMINCVFLFEECAVSKSFRNLVITLPKWLRFVKGWNFFLKHAAKRRWFILWHCFLLRINSLAKQTCYTIANEHQSNCRVMVTMGNCRLQLLLFAQGPQITLKPRFALRPKVAFHLTLCEQSATFVYQVLPHAVATSDRVRSYLPVIRLRAT